MRSFKPIGRATELPVSRERVCDMRLQSGKFNDFNFKGDLYAEGMRFHLSMEIVANSIRDFPR